MRTTGLDKMVIHEEAADNHLTDTNATLGDLLVHSSMPAAAVAVKFCGEDSAEEASAPKRRDILNTFKRRAFSRISFKGESGPLLSRGGFTSSSNQRFLVVTFAVTLRRRN